MLSHYSFIADFKYKYCTYIFPIDRTMQMCYYAIGLKKFHAEISLRLIEMF